MLLKLFTTFFRIGAFTFGGGYAMLPLMQKELVENQGWLEDSDFIDIIAIAQSSPGPVAVNTSIYIGYKLKGLAGALVCLLGTSLPSFLIILFIAMFFYEYRNNPIIDKVFLGIRPAVVALIAIAVYKLGKSLKLDKTKIGITLATLIAIVVFNISPIYIILAGGIGGIIINKRKEQRS